MFGQKQNWHEILNQTGRLLQPSGLSIILTLFASLAIVIGTVASSNYNSSDLHYLVQAEKDKSKPGFAAYTPLPDRLSTSQLISDIPLLIFWMIIGLVAYSFVTAVYRAVTRAVDMGRELDYVHADRQALIRQAVIRLVIRLLALMGWTLYAALTVSSLLPYILAMSAAAKGAGDILLGIGYGAAAVGLAVVFLHIHLIFLRLVTLRPRVFGGAQAA